MGSGYEYVKNSRHNLKRRLLYSMGNKCCLCGYKKCTSALEFHHKNPEEKDFTLSANANIAFIKAIEEVKKCILVCANCHREIHENLISVEEIECYDESKAQEMQQEIDDIKTKTIHYCQSCGKIISYGATRCPECAKVAKRHCERPEREELKKLIRSYPFTTLASNFGVTDNAIRKWCDAYNLPRTKKEINSYSDEEWKSI